MTRAVLHVVPSLDREYGGPAVAVPSLAREMVQCGWKPFFVSGQFNAATQNELMTNINNHQNMILSIFYS